MPYRALQERFEAVDEIITSTDEQLNTLYSTLRKLPDLQKGLNRIRYKQASLTCLLKHISVSSTWLSVYAARAGTPSEYI